MNERAEGVSRNAYVTALRMLARRRLTEAQLWERLERHGFPGGDVRAAVERCKRDGYVDDRLFARLHIEQRRRAIGDARLVGELVLKGVDREAAYDALRESESGETERIDAAIAKIFRTKPGISYASAARAMERLGFPASLIYRKLREHAAAFGPFAEAATEDG
ncbi:MAG: regulatory protein RecX [Vulcanimicrobiaceae bacterium]